MINSDLEMLDPVDFVGPKGRLFFDTNVFMDTDPERKGRIGVLLRRCAEVIKANRNPINCCCDQGCRGAQAAESHGRSRAGGCNRKG